MKYTKYRIQSTENTVTALPWLPKNAVWPRFSSIRRVCPNNLKIHILKLFFTLNWPRPLKNSKSKLEMSYVQIIKFILRSHPKNSLHCNKYCHHMSTYPNRHRRYPMPGMTNSWIVPNKSASNLNLSTVQKLDSVYYQHNPQ